MEICTVIEIDFECWFFAEKILNTLIHNRQCSVCGRYPLPSDHPSQAAFRWVSTWIGDRRSAACTSKCWAGGHFSETVRLGTDSVKWPTISAQVFRSFPVPSWNGCGHILMGGNSGGKGRNWQGIRKAGGNRGNKVGGMNKASCHIGGNTKKKL